MTWYVSGDSAVIMYLSVNLSKFRPGLHILRPRAYRRILRLPSEPSGTIWNDGANTDFEARISHYGGDSLSLRVLLTKANQFLLTYSNNHQQHPMQLITANLPKIITLCKKYKVKALYVFGSILTPRFNDQSDVDFSAIFNHDSDPLVAGENFMNFYMDLEKLMGRKIDLVDEEFIRNKYFREELDETKQMIYG